MQHIPAIGLSHASPVALGLRVLVVSGGPEQGVIPHLRWLGCRVDVETELYSALSSVIDDPSGYALMVIDCDQTGPGSEQAALRNLRAVEARVPLILLSALYPAQSLPEAGAEAVRLPMPLCEGALERGVEHALRHRMAWRVT